MNVTTITEALASFARRAAEETAEGVISTAIAVLILAFVGAGMFVGFQALTADQCQAVANELNTTVGGTSDCGGGGGGGAG